MVLEQAGPLQLLDLSRRGQALVTRGMAWTEIRARARGAQEEVELPAAELSFLTDLSDDGTQVVGTDQGTGGGSNFSFYVQKTTPDGESFAYGTYRRMSDLYLSSPLR